MEVWRLEVWRFVRTHRTSSRDREGAVGRNIFQDKPSSTHVRGLVFPALGPPRLDCRIGLLTPAIPRRSLLRVARVLKTTTSSSSSSPIGYFFQLDGSNSWTDGSGELARQSDRSGLLVSDPAYH